MHPGIFNGPSPHKSPPMRPRWNGQFKNAWRTHTGFTTVLDLMRTWNWNSTWATTDDVSRERKVHKYRRERKLRNGLSLSLMDYNNGLQ